MINLKTFNVRFFELDHREELTENVIFETMVTTEKQSIAGQLAAKEFKINSPEVYAEFRHRYFIVCEEV